ncbi:MAG TPA: hypothetical protein VGG74_16080 [Kofleriaceae bacterium]|jgi:hypothetical protein
MKTITLAQLDTVLGGAGTTTTVDGPLYHRSTTNSDYKSCIDQVVKSTAEKYPSTASWWNPWSVDSNAGPRADATVRNMRSTCGLPPSN